MYVYTAEVKILVSQRMPFNAVQFKGLDTCTACSCDYCVLEKQKFMVYVQQSREKRKKRWIDMIKHNSEKLLLMMEDAEYRDE